MAKVPGASVVGAVAVNFILLLSGLGISRASSKTSMTAMKKACEGRSATSLLNQDTALTFNNRGPVATKGPSTRKSAVFSPLLSNRVTLRGDGGT